MEHLQPATSGAAVGAAANAGSLMRSAIACRVKLTGAGMHETFVGIYPTTCDAAIAAIDRAKQLFGDRPCSVIVGTALS